MTGAMAEVSREAAIACLNVWEVLVNPDAGHGNDIYFLFALGKDWVN